MLSFCPWKQVTSAGARTQLRIPFRGDSWIISTWRPQHVSLGCRRRGALLRVYGSVTDLTLFRIRCKIRRQISPRVSSRLFRLFITEKSLFVIRQRWVLCPRHNTCQNLFSYSFIFRFHSRGVRYLRNSSSLETFDIHTGLSICLVTT